MVRQNSNLHISFFFSEEIFSTTERAKNIRVRNRATLYNLLIGLNGYTVCSGVIDEELNGANIVAVPLKEEGDMGMSLNLPSLQILFLLTDLKY